MSRRRPLRLSTSKMHAELRVNPTCGCKARPLVKWDGHPRCSFPTFAKNGEKLKDPSEKSDFFLVFTRSRLDSLLTSDCTSAPATDVGVDDGAQR